MFSVSEPNNKHKPISLLRLVMCIISLLLVLFLSSLDIIIVVTILNTIADKFNAYSKIGWLITGYSLSNALFTLLWGRLAVIFGSKTTLMVSIIIFEIGSLVIAVSNSMDMIIGGRVIAGCGASGIQTLVFAIATSLVDERTRGTIVTLLSLSYAVASALGPYIGGAFTEYVTWRWCFYINLPIGGLALGVFYLSYNPAQKKILKCFPHFFKSVTSFEFKQLLSLKFYMMLLKFLVFELDFFGFAFCSVGFVLLLLGLTFGGNLHPWHSGTIIAYLVVGSFFIVIFFVYDFVIFDMFWQSQYNGNARPLISWATFSKSGIFTATATMFFGCCAYNLQSIHVVQLFQLVFGQSPSRAASHLWSLLIPAFVAIIISGKITSRYGYVKPITLFAGVSGVIGAGLLTLLNGESTNSEQIGYAILSGAAFGCINLSTLLSAQIQIDKNDPKYDEKFIEVTALNTFGKSLGISFGGIVGTTVFTASVRNKLSNLNYDPNIGKSVEALIAYRSQNFDGPNSEIGRLLTSSVRNVFFTSLGFSCMAFIFGIFTSKKKVEKSVPKERVKGDLEENHGNP